MKLLLGIIICIIGIMLSLHLTTYFYSVIIYLSNCITFESVGFLFVFGLFLLGTGPIALFLGIYIIRTKSL